MKRKSSIGDMSLKRRRSSGQLPGLVPDNVDESDQNGSEPQSIYPPFAQELPPLVSADEPISVLRPSINHEPAITYFDIPPASSSRSSKPQTPAPTTVYRTRSASRKLAPLTLPQEETNGKSIITTTEIKEIFTPVATLQPHNPPPTPSVSTFSVAPALFATPRSKPEKYHLFPGHWEMIHAEQHGQDSADLMALKIELIMTSNTYEVRTHGNYADNGVYALEGGNVLTLTGTDGPNKGRSIQCIYKMVATDLLRICYGLDGGLPTSFSTVGTENYVGYYRRVRKLPDTPGKRTGNGDKFLLPGAWDLIHAERHGDEAADILARSTQLQLGSTSFTVMCNNTTSDHGTYTLIGPGAIDFQSNITGDRMTCLYKLVATDMLRVCYGFDGIRPTMFTTSHTSNNYTAYYRRVRDADEAPRTQEVYIPETQPRNLSRTIFNYIFGILSVLCFLALLDYLFFSPNTEVRACFPGIDCTFEQNKRRGLLQGQTESNLLFFFFGPLYNLFRPWHWTELMRDRALKQLSLSSESRVLEVGVGNGFTTEGLLKSTQYVTIVDSSTPRLQSLHKPEEPLIRVRADAENLPANWTNHFDRYVSAGSLQFWPHPQRTIDEAARVVSTGGKVLIVGPIRPSGDCSRLTSILTNMWGLFPSIGDYENWFLAAGLVNITVLELSPEWYDNNTRAGGLLTGVAVSGSKPASFIASSRSPPAPITVGFFGHLRVLPRVVLGSILAACFALEPIWVYIVHAWFGSSLAAFITLIFLPLSIFTYFKVLPWKWTPLGASSELFSGIASLYDNSSPIWEKVWGEHMHTGFYEVGETAQGWTIEQHHAAQVRMMQEFLNLWPLPKPGSHLRVLDVGCGVGGSSRFLYLRLTELGYKVEVVGVTLSSYQCKRAQQLTHAHPDIPRGPVTFRVANALRLSEFPSGSFDLVWSLESGEHIPEKDIWLGEMSRVLREGGTMLCATWCHRSLAGAELTTSEKLLLTRICKIYSLPAFVEPSVYEAAGRKHRLTHFNEREWTQHIVPFWPAVIRSALWPTTLLRIIASLPFGGWTTVKGAVAAVLMMNGFANGTLTYSVFTMTKMSA